MVEKTERIEPFNRNIKGVKILDSTEIENDNTCPFLKGDDLSGDYIWLTPDKTFSPLTDIEFSCLLLTTVILIPFIYLGFEESTTYGYLGVLLLTLLLAISINRFQKIRNQYLHQKLDRKGNKKGLLFDDQFVYFNEGKNVIYQINLDAVQHIRWYKKKNTERVECVVEGKVLFDYRLKDYQHNWDEIVPLLKKYDIKMLNYQGKRI